MNHNIDLRILGLISLSQLANLFIILSKLVCILKDLITVIS